MPAPGIDWPAIGCAGRSGKTAGLWSLRERRLLGASEVAATGAAVGIGRDLCSHVKPVSRGVGCGDSTRPKDARWKKRSGWTVQSEQGRT